MRGTRVGRVFLHKTVVRVVHFKDRRLGVKGKEVEGGISQKLNRKGGKVSRLWVSEVVC